MEKLNGKKVAIIATNGFEQSELLKPREALEKAGAQTKVVSLKSGSIRGWSNKNWGDDVAVDLTLDKANPGDFDALLIPGGVMSPDALRTEEAAVEFVQHFVDLGKPIAAICHGPQLLIETGIVRGRKVTSYAALKTDLINAGADWYDSEVITDQGLVTSRKPDDIPAFNKKMIEEFAEGPHPRQARAQGEDRASLF